MSEQDPLHGMDIVLRDAAGTVIEAIEKIGGAATDVVHGDNEITLSKVDLPGPSDMDDLAAFDIVITIRRSSWP